MSQHRSDDNALSSTQGSIGARLRALESLLAQLLRSPIIRFDDRCRSALPEAHGIYRIFDPTNPDETVRAGRTKTAAGGLIIATVDAKPLENAQGAHATRRGPCAPNKPFQPSRPPRMLESRG